MLRKLIVCSAAIASFQAHACTVYHSTSDIVISDIISKNGWGFDNYDIVCEKLKRANAALVIDGQATVLGGKSIAWASVSLKDKNLMVFTNSYSGAQTSANDFASMDKAKEMLMEVINGAVNNMKIDLAIQGLNESRNRVKSAYSR